MTCFYNEATGHRPFFITNAMSEQLNISHLSSYQRDTLTASRPRPRPEFKPHQPGPEFTPPRKKFVAKGHDSQLQDAQHNKFPVEVTMIGDGGVVKGTVSRRDKYTITVNLTSGTEAGKDLMIFKHAIESVMIDRVQPQPSGE